MGAYITQTILLDAMIVVVRNALQICMQKCNLQPNRNGQKVQLLPKGAANWHY